MKTNLELQHDVMEELKWESSLNSTGIGVSASDGVVTLSGAVDTYAQKRTAVRAAMDIEGVKAVAEELTVKSASGPGSSDTEIARAAVDALRWNPMVPDERIKVKVDNGWVTTEGQVDWIYEKNAVGHTVEELNGVTGVSNLVKVIPRVNPENVENEIRAAFERSATIDADTIRIGIEGNIVILTGTVHSYAEKRDAERAARNAHGIVAVSNRLEVRSTAY